MIAKGVDGITLYGISETWFFKTSQKQKEGSFKFPL